MCVCVLTCTPCSSDCTHPQILCQGSRADALQLSHIRMEGRCRQETLCRRCPQLRLTGEQVSITGLTQFVSLLVPATKSSSKGQLSIMQKKRWFYSAAMETRGFIRTKLQSSIRGKSYQESKDKKCKRQKMYLKGSTLLFVFLFVIYIVTIVTVHFKHGESFRSRM